MNDNLNHNSLAKAEIAFHVDLILGSRMRDIPVVSTTLAKKDGINAKQMTGHLFFDWEGKVHCHVDGQLDREIVEAFDNDCIEAALPPTEEALKKAEEAGDLRPAPDGWYLNPRVIAEKMGVGGNPLYALLLALVNSLPLTRKLNKIFQEARAHAQQNERVLEGMEEVPIRVPFIVWFSAPGGMGSGAMCWFVGEEGIRSCAEQNGVQATITVRIVCRGSLEAKDNEKADLNESIALRHIQALASGTYVSPQTGRKHPTIDSIVLASNQNSAGSLTQFDDLIVQEGHCDYFLYDTPAGARMRTAAVDIQDWEVGPHGEPRAGMTMGLASLSRDNDMLLGSCKYKAAALLTEAMRAPSDPEKTQQEALDLARQLKMVESDEENLLTATLSHLAEFGGEDAVERAQESLRDRIAGCRGLEGAIVVEESVRAVINNDISQLYGAMMGKQAKNHAQTVKDALHAYQEQAMKSADGLSRCRSVFALLLLVFRQSAESLMAKARELRELARPHEQIIVEVSEQINNLRQRRWPARAANHFLIKRLSTALQESGTSLISYQLQITVCEIGVAELLTPVIEWLDNQCGWLSGMDHKLIQAVQICEIKAHSAVAKRTVLTPRVGIELVTAGYAKTYFDDFAHLHGGQDQFAAHLLQQYLQEYGSLAVLTDAPLEEYEEAFTAVGARVFRPQVESENVTDEFRRVHRNESKQLRILSRLVKQSEGSIRTAGECNEPITWIKTANAPTPEAAEWLAKTLPRVDKKEGPWDIAVSGQRDRIDLGQLRGGISLQSLIDRIPIPDDPSGWAKLISHAPDPGTALLVPPNPTPRQFRRVLAKAIVNGQLTASPNGDYVLTASSGEMVDLGNDPPSVEAFLQPKWQELVFLESTFAHNLVVAEGQIMSALKDLKAQIQSGTSASDLRLQVIDLTAVEECLVQADLMLPRMRRMRKAIRNKSTP